MKEKFFGSQKLKKKKKSSARLYVNISSSIESLLWLIQSNYRKIKSIEIQKSRKFIQPKRIHNNSKCTIIYFSFFRFSNLGKGSVLARETHTQHTGDYIQWCDIQYVYQEFGLSCGPLLLLLRLLFNNRLFVFLILKPKTFFVAIFIRITDHRSIDYQKYEGFARAYIWRTLNRL